MELMLRWLLQTFLGYTDDVCQLVLHDVDVGSVFSAAAVFVHRLGTIVVAREINGHAAVQCWALVMVLIEGYVIGMWRVVRGFVPGDRWIAALLVLVDAVLPPLRIWQYCHWKMDSTTSLTKSLIDRTT